MTTELENRLTAALDQMARTAVPDAIDTADATDDRVTDLGAHLATRTVNDRHRRGRLLTVAASLALVVGGTVAVAAAMRNDRSTPNSTNNTSAPPAPTEEPTSVSSDSSAEEVTAPADTVAPGVTTAVAIINPDVAGSTPVRQNHVEKWLYDETQSGYGLGYRARTGGGYDGVSWAGYPSYEWDKSGLELPVDEELSANAGVDVRRQIAGDQLTVIMMRLAGDTSAEGIVIDLPLSVEPELRAWLQAAAASVAEQGAGAVTSIALPEGFTAVAPRAEMEFVYYPTQNARTPSVSTESFSEVIDPVAWIAAVYPGTSLGEQVTVASGTAWRLSDPRADALNDPSTTVVWQPSADTIVTLNGPDVDIDRLAQGLTMVPADSDLIGEAGLGEGMGMSDSPSAGDVEVLAETPVGRFAYVAWTANDETCRRLESPNFGGGGGCDGESSRSVDVMCEANTGWSYEGVAHAFAMVDPTQVDFVEVRRGGDAEPLPTEVFNGDYNGRPWALVFASVAASADDPALEVRFTGGACQQDGEATG